MREITSCRVHDMPAELAHAGISAWFASGPVSALGCKPVCTVYGPSGDKSGTLFLSVVIEQGRAAIGPDQIERVKEWAKSKMPGEVFGVSF